jgi:hypothetical protein
MSYEKRRAAANALKGLDANMRQGNRGHKGDASKAGDLRKVMGQGSRPERKAPVGKLGSIMGQ